jgi:serine/threonine protein kinase
MSAIHGFSLDQLLATVQKAEFFALRGEEKTVPRVLVLHIAKQMTSAVEWLHNAIQIAHRDTLDANVILSVSSSSSEAAFEMPTVVLIDFDNAAFQPTEVQKSDGCAFVYELLYSLGSKATVYVDEEPGDAKFGPKDGERW